MSAKRLTPDQLADREIEREIREELEVDQVVPQHVWRKEARDHIAGYKKWYDKTQNPVYAWSAYRESREHEGMRGSPPPLMAAMLIPPWVLAYFDAAGANLDKLKTSGWYLAAGLRVQKLPSMATIPEKKKIAPAVAAALGFVPGGVRRNWSTSEPSRQQTKTGNFNALDVSDDRDSLLAFRVYLRISGESSDQLLYAYQQTAEEAGVSQRTVERAWKKYKSGFAKK